MNAKMIRYYQKKMHGGRTIVARFIDFIFFRFLLAIMMFAIFLYLSHSFVTSLLISLFLTIAVSLILLTVNRNKMKHFIEMDLKRIKEKCLLETLTFMSANDFIDYISRLFDGFVDIAVSKNGFFARKNGKRIVAFQNHPNTKVQVYDVLNAIRGCEESLVFISLSEFHDDVKAISKNLDQSVVLIDGARILKVAAKKNMLPDEEVAQLRAENEMKDSILTLDKIKTSALNRTKVKRYVFCGIVVMLWSIVTGFRIYYPIIAAACFLLALFTLRHRSEDKESSDAGLS
jgi:hypothetical protein